MRDFCGGFWIMWRVVERRGSILSGTQVCLEAHGTIFRDVVRTEHCRLCVVSVWWSIFKDNVSYTHLWCAGEVHVLSKAQKLAPYWLMHTCGVQVIPKCVHKLRSNLTWFQNGEVGTVEKGQLNWPQFIGIGLKHFVYLYKCHEYFPSMGSSSGPQLWCFLLATCMCRTGFHP